MANRLRAREAGIRLGYLPTGEHNSITDIAGVRVGHTTLISGDGKLIPGQGPIRTGVTAILPHEGNLFTDKVAAYAQVVNGFGKSIGLAQIQELGTIETPILLTNTLNAGLAADALITYMIKQNPDIGINTGTVNPVVGECNDGFLNDIQGRHVRPEHVWSALENAAAGPVAEGAVGGGTGMVCFGFKGGIGTSSRFISAEMGGFGVGVLVMSNFGRRQDLLIGGVPVGRELLHYEEQGVPGDGSIMMIVATDAPLSTRQLGRVARRAAFGLARTGSVASHGSGDFIIAFSTTNRQPEDGQRIRTVTRLSEDGAVLTSLFDAAVEATEEAIINSLFAAGTMVGRDGHVRYGLPIDEVIKIMKNYNRM